MAVNVQIAGIRKEYSKRALSEENVDTDAIRQFARWWDEAMESQVEEINAMTLATCSLDARPSARIVLLKGFSEAGFIFFTNYNSKKGRDLEENPRASLVFFWKELERQVRIEGIVKKTSEKESDEYFDIRPLQSRISAFSSPQSQVIESRQYLENIVVENKNRYADVPVTRPSHWGGYIVKPEIIEFWQGRRNRLHDRLQYKTDAEGHWYIERLAP
ncbi:MAG: pyridoxamine 5'-phosphate oxidase [Ginsengibacter sp.]